MRSLPGHGHWVNTLALSTEHALRSGAHDEHGLSPSEPDAALKVGMVEVLLTLKGCLCSSVHDHGPSRVQAWQQSTYKPRVIVEQVVSGLMLSRKAHFSCLMAQLEAVQQQHCSLSFINIIIIIIIITILPWDLDILSLFCTCFALYHCKAHWASAFRELWGWLLLQWP